MTSDAPTLAPGDILRVERRYVLDGQLTSVADEGRFQGIERIGSSEHLVLRDSNKEVRMIPLHAIAEIKLVRHARRPRAKASSSAAVPTGPAAPAAWDPSFA
jgi:hypothetical protein